MADIFLRSELLWVDDIGGRDLRVALLALEPGALIWLSLDGEEILFERLPDGAAGESQRTFRPTGETASLWLDLLARGLPRYVEEVVIVERPKDRGAAGDGFYRGEIDASAQQQEYRR